MTTIGQRIVADIQMKLFAPADARRSRLFPRQPHRDADLALHQRRQPAARLRHQRPRRHRQGGGDRGFPDRADVLSGLGAGAHRLDRFPARLPAAASASASACAASRPTPRPSSASSRHLLDQTFQGARHVKAYGMEAYETTRAGASSRASIAWSQRAARVRSISSPLMETLGRRCRRAGHSLWRPSGDATARARRARSSPSSRRLLLAYQPLKTVAGLNASLQEGLAAAQRLFTVLDIEPEIYDRAGRPAAAR